MEHKEKKFAAELNISWRENCFISGNMHLSHKKTDVCGEISGNTSIDISLNKALTRSRDQSEVFLKIILAKISQYA